MAKQWTPVKGIPTRGTPTGLAIAFALGLVAGGLIAGNLGAPSRAQAQAVHLNQYRQAETPEDGFAVSRATARGHLRFAGMLHLDYANNPLVWERDQGDMTTEQFPIVEHQLTAQLALSFGLWDRLVIYAGLPVTLLMEGETDGVNSAGLTADASPNVGDLWLGARGRIIGETDDRFVLSAQATLTFPTAWAQDPLQQWSGEDGVTLHPEILGEVRVDELLPGFRVNLNIGARFRFTDNASDLGPPGNELGISHEFTWGAGLWVPILRETYSCSEDNPDPTNCPRYDMLAATVEFYGNNTFEDFLNRESSPAEGLLGLRYQPIQGLHIGLAGAMGLARGYGSPDGRVVLTVGYAQPSGPVDSDGDGLFDSVDECPYEAEDFDEFQDEDGCPDPDNDQDGILDGDDRWDPEAHPGFTGEPSNPVCMNDAEDPDGFQDEDGCPDLDNDGDGYPDASDQCPNQAEDFDEFEDEDGCPDPDNDQDGILDGVDRRQVGEGPDAGWLDCKNDPEDRDNFEDEDGCPDPDNDQDGTPDVEDREVDENGNVLRVCPNDAGVRPGEPEYDRYHGCPRGVVDCDNPANINHPLCTRCRENPLACGWRTDPILFATDSDELAVPRSRGRGRGNDAGQSADQNVQIIRSLAEILRSNAGFRVLRIEGHTDSRGPVRGRNSEVGNRYYNMGLSQHRAARVYRELVETYHIDPRRLQVFGCGQEYPVTSNITTVGRAENRRVEFHLVDPAPPRGARNLARCLPVNDPPNWGTIRRQYRTDGTSLSRGRGEVPEWMGRQDAEAAPAPAEGGSR